MKHTPCKCCPAWHLTAPWVLLQESPRTAQIRHKRPISADGSSAQAGSLGDHSAWNMSKVTGYLRQLFVS